MHDCASKFSDDSGALAGLTDPDREEWYAALSNLGRTNPPSGAVWLSASHDAFIENLSAHISRHERVIVLAGRAWTAQRQHALAAGAYEFLSTGPVDAAELSARLRLIETGSALPKGTMLSGKQLQIGQVEHELTDREVEIMTLLIAAKGRFVVHDELLALWGRHAYEPQYLRVAIGKLRRRIEPEPDMPRYLLSEAAIGYRLVGGIE